MSVLQAIILGIVQGLTEFLPVSSSGHLAIMKNLLRVNTDTGILFDILLHVATLISICIVMYKDIIRLFFEFITLIADLFANLKLLFVNMGTNGSKKKYRQLVTNSYRKFVILVVLSTIPTGILGILLKDMVERVEESLLVPGICLIMTGFILLLSDHIEEGNKKPKDANWGDALVIGASQGVAALPGLSRSGTTITACLLCGFDRKFAVKYSFIMSIPAVLGALVIKLTDLGSEKITASDVGAYIVGMLIAAVVGFFALRLMYKIVINKFFKYFAFYCFGIGAISVIAFLIMM